MIILNKNSKAFPDPELAGQEGLIAIGGDLSPQRLIEAYKNGIFPWYSEGEPILWWSPNPRCVLFLNELHVPKRLLRKIRNSPIKVSFNQAFREVIESCAKIHKIKDSGTWITKEMIEAYVKLFEMGYCISAESWLDNRLVGGLYGVYVNKVFSGESMFSLISDASKIAFVKLTQYLKDRGCKIIDCQQPSEHMLRFGAKLIPRRDFIKILKKSSE